MLTQEANSIAEALTLSPPQPDAEYFLKQAKNRLLEFKSKEKKRLRVNSEIELKRDEVLRGELEAMAADRHRRMAELDAARTREVDELRLRRERERTGRKEQQVRLKAEEAARRRALAAMGPTLRTKPLFKRMQEEYAAKEAETARARDAVRLRDKAGPLDYEALRQTAAAHDAARAAQLAENEQKRKEQSGIGRVPTYYAGRARERIVKEDEKLANRFEQSHEAALESKAKQTRYAALVHEINGGGGFGNLPAHRSHAELDAEEEEEEESALVDLRALEAEVSIRAAAVAAFEADAVEAERYVGAEALDRCEKQSELSTAYVESIKAKLALHAALPEIPA